MPIDDLTAWGQIMRKARKEKDLTQQELFRPKPCFCKANRQYRKRENESFLFDFESIGKGPAHLFRYAYKSCLLYTSPSPRDRTRSRMPSSA